MPSDPLASDSQSVQTLLVTPAAHFRVCEGVNRGEPISFAEELVLEDSYELRPDAPRLRLALALAEGPGTFTLAEGSEAGQPGATVVADCCVTFMSPEGGTQDAVVFVELDGDAAGAIYLLPLAPLKPKTPYVLVGTDRKIAPAKLAEVACAAFTRGTHITLASGELRPIEALNAGDRLLTRDSGAQEIRWIGSYTVRATGPLAPIVITAGTLNNLGDLVVSPDHRLFVYQRTDHLGAGRAEVLVKARHLLNGSTVYQQQGGFVDYFQVLFDDHQILYAEGIAAESMLLDPRTRASLPAEVQDQLSAGTDQASLPYEISEGLIQRPDAAALLRRASSR